MLTSTPSQEERGPRIGPGHVVSRRGSEGGQSPARMGPMALLGRLYAKRIINVNVNIIVAGLLAMGLTLIPVHMTRHVGIDTKWMIVAITLGFDVVFDVAIYFFLHWLANHWRAFPWVKHRRGHHAQLSFIRDATLVQFERALLAPVYYGTLVGAQWVLLHELPDGADQRELAAVLGLGSGLLVTRLLHTAWMLHTEHRYRRRHGTRSPLLCPTCGGPIPLPDAACPVCALAAKEQVEVRERSA
jgi:hypothetical protein